MTQRARSAAVRAVGWLMWASMILLAPALVQQSAAPGTRLPLELYLWTSAIPVSLVLAALGCAFRDRLVPWRGRVLVVSFVAAALYLAVLGVWYVTVRDFSVPAMVMRVVAWLERGLRWASWCGWGLCLPAWVLAEPSGAEPASPLEGVPGVDGLTGRERVVAEALVAGWTVTEVASELAISPSTVATYRARACEKLCVDSLDELVPLVPEPPKPDVDITSRAARPLAILVLCAALMARLLFGIFDYAPMRSQLWVSQASGCAVVVVLLVVPYLAAVIYAHTQRMWLRRPTLSTRLTAVLLALLVLGLAVGGKQGIWIPVPSGSMGVWAVAFPVYCVAWALLVPYVADPGLDTPVELSERRCLLYLQGRGTGELQAQVLLHIAKGERAPDICERLSVARGTVNAYRAQGYELLGIHTRNELAALLARDTGVRPSADKNRPFAEAGD